MNRVLPPCQVSEEWVPGAEAARWATEDLGCPGKGLFVPFLILLCTSRSPKLRNRDPRDRDPPKCLSTKDYLPGCFLSKNQPPGADKRKAPYAGNTGTERRRGARASSKGACWIAAFERI